MLVCFYDRRVYILILCTLVKFACTHTLQKQLIYSDVKHILAYKPLLHSRRYLSCSVCAAVAVKTRASRNNFRNRHRSGYIVKLHIRITLLSKRLSAECVIPCSAVTDHKSVKAVCTAQHIIDKIRVCA